MLNVGSASNSMAALDALIPRISRSLSASSFDVVEVRRDDVNNRDEVLVGSSPDRVRAFLAQAVGTGPYVVEQTCQRAARAYTDQTPPPTGGDEIERQSSQSGFVIQCTTAFYSQRVVNGVTSNYMLSAGHCNDATNPASTNYKWDLGPYPGTFTLGTEASTRFQSNSSDDATIINMPSGTGQPLIYDPNNNSFDLDVDGVSQFGDGSDIVNANICQEGHDGATDTPTQTCGLITSVNSTITYPAGDGYPSVTIPNAREDSNYCAPGWSGGSVFESPLRSRTIDVYFTQYLTHAVGIISGYFTNSNSCIYTHVQYAISDFGVQIVTG